MGTPYDNREIEARVGYTMTDSLESDADLRTRIAYVTGARVLECDSRLDELAARYGLKRRVHPPAAAKLVIGVDPGYGDSHKMFAFAGRAPAVAVGGNTFSNRGFTGKAKP
jgi:hypothetical protein